jgi:hypothetical protein
MGWETWHLDWGPVLGGYVFSLAAEGGWIRSLEDNGVAGQDDVRLTDRFFLGEPQMRGFDIRGVGPRIVRLQYIDDDGDDSTPLVPQDIETALASDQRVDDSLGGKAYWNQFEATPEFSTKLDAPEKTTFDPEAKYDTSSARQDEIDKLIADQQKGGGGKASQDEIDKLFSGENNG